MGICGWILSRLTLALEDSMICYLGKDVVSPICSILITAIYSTTYMLFIGIVTTGEAGRFVAAMIRHPPIRLTLRRLPVSRLPFRRPPVSRLPFSLPPVSRLPFRRPPLRRLPFKRLPLRRPPVS